MPRLPVVPKPGDSLLVTRSTRHSLKLCDELTILLNKVVTSWPYLVSNDGLFVLAVGTEGNA